MCEQGVMGDRGACIQGWKGVIMGGDFVIFSFWSYHVLFIIPIGLFITLRLFHFIILHIYACL